jgi:invasion protein IalB
MRARGFALVVAMLLSASAAHADPFMSPALEADTFKDSAVRSYSATVGAWSYACQEITTLKKRVCNLATHLKGEDGAPAGVALVATDDRNATAMLLRLPLPVVVGQPVLVRTQFMPAKGAKKLVTYTMTARVGMCSEAECRVFVTLDNPVVYAMNNAIDVTVQYERPVGDAFAFEMQQFAVSLTIPGEGFSGALKGATGE